MPALFTILIWLLLGATAQAASSCSTLNNCRRVCSPEQCAGTVQCIIVPRGKDIAFHFVDRVLSLSTRDFLAKDQAPEVVTHTIPAGISTVRLCGGMSPPDEASGNPTGFDAAVPQ